jgi:hypothetical protein
MLLGVGKREHAAPRPAPDQPALDAELVPQQLDVGDQELRGVRAERCRRIAGMRPAATTAALVEEDHAVGVGVEQAAMPGRASRPGAAVEHDHRPAARVAGLLPVDLLPIAGVQPAV